jgi:tetratricopeptide (TPR) repeat protein
MIRLLSIVVDSNNGGYENLPPLKGGCKEVHGVYNTFSKLNKIVKVSNISFFSGDLEVAHHFVSDALALYRKIHDRKAIGVACNNLANTLFALRFEGGNNVHCCKSTSACTISEALALYDEAVEIADDELKSCSNDAMKADYATQLADRLFNRGLFLLFIDGYECAPQDSRARGYQDVTSARDLHYDVKGYMLAHRQIFSNASSYFSRLLRRINCLAAFYDDIGLQEIWNAEDLLDEADQLATAAWEAHAKGGCPLFNEVTQSGRRQQLESSAILLALRSEDFLQASKLGIRMLVEDSFLLESSFARSAEALLQVMKEGDVGFSRKTIAATRDGLRSMLKSCRKVSLDIGKNVILAFEISEKCVDSQLLEELNTRCLELYDNSFSSDDHIGVVANNVKDTSTVELGSKEENEGRQRTFIDVATSSFTPSDDVQACLPISLQMLIDSPLSLQSDSYLILITDGSMQDTMDFSSLKAQIERLNMERNYQIHVLVVGLNVEDERKKTLLEDLGDVSKASTFVTSDDLDSAFQSVSSIVNGRVSNQFISFLTMEKF